MTYDLWLMTIESYDLWLNDLENFYMTLSYANTEKCSKGQRVIKVNEKNKGKRREWG